VTPDRSRSLQETLSEVAAAAASLRDRGRRASEQDTKAVLIEPVLDALGWNMRDPDEVTREYRHKPQDNPVDYSLMLRRSPCLFVEAKAIGVNLNDRKWIAQSVSYASTAGVEWCVLTNGEEYRIYKAHLAVDVEEKLFRTVSLSSSSDLALAATTLVLLSKANMKERALEDAWKTHFVDQQVKAALDDHFRTSSASLVRLLQKSTNGLTRSEIEKSIKRAEISVSFPQPSESPRASAPRRPSRSSGTSKRPATKSELAGLVAAGVIPAPLDLTVTYKKAALSARIEKDGTVTFDGKSYASLSMAGGVARVKVSGPPKDGRECYATNGWTFWRYRDPETNELAFVDRLRRRKP